MKKLWLILLLFFSVFSYCQSINNSGINRERININREWKFKLGDYNGAETELYNDQDWSRINLPHNFSIPYFRSNEWYTGYGWYRKYFDVPVDWKNKRIFVEFEGAFRDAQIYVNGQQVGSHKGGYTGFSIDITKQIKTGSNVLAVRLNNNWNARLAPRNGDHNFTGGIYRDVYLVITNPVHVTWYGTFVTTPRVSKASAVVNIKTEVRNDGSNSKNYTLKTDIFDPSGEIVAKISAKQHIEPKASIVYNQTTTEIKKPLLWHPQHPFMYKAVTSILDGNVTIDKYETPFGIRWMNWTTDSGFFLNGEHYYFKGANVHQDHAGWASAVTNAAILRDVHMIKDCGMDFIRGSHYPHDPSFSDACDTLGILLWEENDFWGSGGTQKESDNWYEGSGAYPVNKEDQHDFEESVKSDLNEMIRIHRNHPSIIVWSMCNEPFFTERATMSQVKRFLSDLTKLTHELDSTRAVGIGGCQRGGIDKLGDVAGYNGDGARLFINPGIPNVVTEYGSTIAIRPGKFEPGWGDLQLEQYKWRSGQSLWCAFDYGTRAGDFGLMGMIDYFRLPKNMWYWYRYEYKHISPPDSVKKGVAAKLKLTADKTTISNTDGTDDIYLIVTVLDKDGKQISNSPDVTLQIVSGSGEFPTGSSITFSNTSDIYIRDGKAAIEFRSYYGGRTIIKATSENLESDSIIIETKGSPLYSEGVSPKVVERPYVRFTTKHISSNDNSRVNIAYQKPTRASSEMEGKTANRANDSDTSTYWQSGMNEPNSWWQVDLENIYSVSEVRIMFPAGELCPYEIALSNDNQNWQVVTKQDKVDGMQKNYIHHTNNNKGRFLRITFYCRLNKPVVINEVQVYGKSINQ
jgi:hypothetical protein